MSTDSNTVTGKPVMSGYDWDESKGWFIRRIAGISWLPMPDNVYGRVLFEAPRDYVSEFEDGSRAQFSKTTGSKVGPQVIPTFRLPSWWVSAFGHTLLPSPSFDDQLIGLLS